jgi:hypothetical protein
MIAGQWFWNDYSLSFPSRFAQTRIMPTYPDFQWFIPIRFSNDTIWFLIFEHFQSSPMQDISALLGTQHFGKPILTRQEPITAHDHPSTNKILVWGVIVVGLHDLGALNVWTWRLGHRYMRWAQLWIGKGTPAHTPPFSLHVTWQLYLTHNFVVNIAAA